MNAYTKCGCGEKATEYGPLGNNCLLCLLKNAALPNRLAPLGDEEEKRLLAEAKELAERQLYEQKYSVAEMHARKIMEHCINDERYYEKEKLTWSVTLRSMVDELLARRQTQMYAQKSAELTQEIKTKAEILDKEVKTRQVVKDELDKGIEQRRDIYKRMEQKTEDAGKILAAGNDLMKLSPARRFAILARIAEQLGAAMKEEQDLARRVKAETDVQLVHGRKNARQKSLGKTDIDYRLAQEGFPVRDDLTPLDRLDYERKRFRVALELSLLTAEETIEFYNMGGLP